MLPQSSSQNKVHLPNSELQVLEGLMCFLQQREQERWTELSYWGKAMGPGRIYETKMLLV